MKLSIIIPVYKTEATLNRCVQSILGQSYDDFEIILVDDGSPDGAPALCDEWAASDNRIQVIHKENGGLSDARNAGIEKARGEWVTFVDSDDYLDADTYEQAMKQADTDIVEFPIYCHYGSEKAQRMSFEGKLYTDGADYWLNGYAYEHSYACNKIFRRRLFEEVRFPMGCVFEDMATLPLLVDKAKTIRTMGSGCYYYTENPEGITNNATGHELGMLLDAHLQTMERWGDDRYYMHVLNIQLDVVRLTGHEPKLPRRHVSLTTKGLSMRHRVKAIILNLFGIKILCNINKQMHQK